MKKGRFLLIWRCLGLLLPLHAQETDGTFAFLKATNSARVAALGGLPLPIFDGDIQTSVFNPATIGTEMHHRMGLSYVDYFTDINFGTAQYARSFDQLGSFAATVQFHNYGDFQETTESGLATGTSFTGSDYAVQLGWGRRLTPHWSIGASIKYAGLQYEQYAAGALAVDVAGAYRSEAGWLFSLTARNIGTQLFNQFDVRRVRLPFEMDFGVSKHLDHLPLTLMFWYDDLQQWNKLYDDPLDLEGNVDPFTGEVQQESAVAHFAKNVGCHVVVAGELSLGKNLMLRAAYNYGQRHAMDVPSERTLVGFSAGFAVKVKMFQLSYARARSNINASPNYLTLTMDLNQF